MASFNAYIPGMNRAIRTFLEDAGRCTSTPNTPKTK